MKIKIGWRAENASYVGIDFLHDLMIIRQVVAAHVVTIHEINMAGFVAANDEMRINAAAHLIGQQKRAARSEIRIRRLHFRLIEWSEIIRHRQPVAGGGKLHEAVAVIHPVAQGWIGVETAIGHLEVEIGIRIHAQPIAAHP